MSKLTIIGAGLAGCEAAWQAALRGIQVELYEMRPNQETGAHKTGLFAELVCSNSLGSNLINKSTGLLNHELRLMNSLLIRCADENIVPAGAALAVDRIGFAKMVTENIENHPNIEIIREEASKIPKNTTIIASGPLTSKNLVEKITDLTGEDQLFFFDALAPIVQKDTINFDKAFYGSRYNKGVEEEGDYINCPFDQEEYNLFIEALLQAKKVDLRDFEKDITNGVTAGDRRYFEGCLPIEVLASRGHDSLAFGPLRPVGLYDPKTGKRPFAVLQLRQDNFSKSLYNLVGFQTNLTFPEQKKIFQMIPGLENAEFERLGQMHRNTFISSPRLLQNTLQFKTRGDLFFAGQITGLEGYSGSIAAGLLAGVNAAFLMKNKELLTLPKTSMFGALINFITTAEMKDFQPVKANFGILPGFEPKIRSKKERYQAYSKRAIQDITETLQNTDFFLNFD